MLENTIHRVLNQTLNIRSSDKTNVLKKKFLDTLDIFTSAGKIGSKPPLPNYTNMDLINTAIQKLEIANTL